MPIRQLDRAAIRREARELIRTARVSPIKFTLLFLAVSLALSLLDTALTSLTGRIVGVAFVSVSFASILIGLITQVLDAGYKCYCLGVHRREEMPYESLFDGFTFAGKVIALYIVEGFAPETVMLCVAYVASRGKRTMGAVSHELKVWRAEGVESGEQADAHLQLLSLRAQREQYVSGLLGIAERSEEHTSELQSLV